LHRLYQHRRAILRATWFDTNTNANCNSYCDVDRYTHGYGDGNAYANCDALHGQMCTDAQAASDSGASPLALT
jgi:hypothetical protein